MSSYRSTTTVIDADIADAVGLATAEYAALQHTCSAEVAALAHQAATISAKDPLASAHAWSAIDGTLPEWESRLPAASAAILTSARAGEVPIASALRTVAAELASLERFAVADMSNASLLDLGYTVQRVDGQHTSALEARKGHETFLVVVGDQGRVETDHLGLMGDECNDRQRDFVDQMGRRGIHFDEGVAVQHHDPRGGSGIAAAVAARATTLAAGAVAVQDARPSAFTTSLLAPAAPVSTRLLAGESR